MFSYIWYDVTFLYDNNFFVIIPFLISFWNPLNRTMQFLLVLTLYPIIESTPPLSLLVLDVFFSPLLAPWKRIETREVLLVLSRATGFQKCAPFLEFIIFIHYIIIEIIHFCLLILLLNFYINNAIFLIPTSRMSILLLVYLFVLEQLGSWNEWKLLRNSFINHIYEIYPICIWKRSDTWDFMLPRMKKSDLSNVHCVGFCMVFCNQM